MRAGFSLYLYGLKAALRTPVPASAWLGNTPSAALSTAAEPLDATRPGRMMLGYGEADLRVPGVACAVIGARRREEVRRAVQAARAFRPLSAAHVREAAQGGAGVVATGAAEYALLCAHFARDGAWREVQEEARWRASG